MTKDFTEILLALRDELSADFEAKVSVEKVDMGFRAQHESGLSIERTGEEEARAALILFAGFSVMPYGDEPSAAEWTFAQHHMALEAKKRGLPYSQLGRTIGKSRGAISGHLWSGLGWTTVPAHRLSPWSPEETALLIALREEHKLTWEAIGDKLDRIGRACCEQYGLIKGTKKKKSRTRCIDRG